MSNLPFNQISDPLTDTPASQDAAKLKKPASGPTFLVGERFVSAIALAVELHRGHARKQQGIPYISHLMDVSALVMQYGGNEDQAIAALLHDGPEDNGGRATLERIQRQFGDHVARMVEDCSDSFEGEDDGLDWVGRKQAHMDHFRKFALVESCLVYTADKISNTRTLAAYLRRCGAAAWSAFSSDPEQKVWYMRGMAAIFRERETASGKTGSRALDALAAVDELDRSLDTLEQVMHQVSHG